MPGEFPLGRAFRRAPSCRSPARVPVPGSGPSSWLGSLLPARVPRSPLTALPRVPRARLCGALPPPGGRRWRCSAAWAGAAAAGIPSAPCGTPREGRCWLASRPQRAFPVVLLEVVLCVDMVRQVFVIFIVSFCCYFFKTCGPLWAQQCGRQYYATGVCSEISPSFEILRSFSPAVQSKATCTKHIQLKKAKTTKPNISKKNQEILCGGLLILIS